MPYLLTILLIVLSDQALKLIVQTKLDPFQSMFRFKNIFSLTYVQNYGAAFGILQFQKWLLITLSVGVIIFVWLNRRKLTYYPQIFQIGLAVALGGALGNLVDRVRLGYVVDFLDFNFWPVFNLADMAIVIGVGLIITGLYLHKPGTTDQIKPAPRSSGTAGKEDY